jgi:general secretion pathway protein K
MSDCRDERGFALITVLWLLALLGALTAGLLTTVRREQHLAENRIALERGAWAMEGCLAILEARYQHDSAIRAVDSTDLGQGSWCRAEVSDLGGRINVNSAPDGLLAAALGSDTLVAAVLDWRDPDTLARPGGAERSWYAAHGREPPRDGPFESVRELRLVRGLERASVAALDPLFTVDGDGRVNPYLLPDGLLRALPGFGAATALAIRGVGSAGQRATSLDQFIGTLPPSSRTGIAAAYPALSSLLVFQPAWLEIRFEARAPPNDIISRMRVLAVPLEGRLAIVAREPA